MTCHVPRLLLAAPASGSGKTPLTCALLRVLERRGLSPCAFKCGPDYIDPMFHRSVLGLPSRNLDLFFSSPDEVRRNLALGAQGRGAAVIEGVMGYYDGVGGAFRYILRRRRGVWRRRSRTRCASARDLLTRGPSAAWPPCAS